MNEETTLPSAESSVPETEASLPAETEAAATVDGSLIYEDLSGMEYQETAAVMVISLEDLERVSTFNANVDLLGSFLVCGTLIGLAFLRDRHGN